MAHKFGNLPVKVFGPQPSRLSQFRHPHSYKIRLKKKNQSLDSLRLKNWTTYPYASEAAILSQSTRKDQLLNKEHHNHYDYHHSVKAVKISTPIPY